MKGFIARLVKRLVKLSMIAAVLGALAFFYLHIYFQTPVAPEAKEQIVAIAAGSTLRQIANGLADHGLIRHRAMLIAYVTWWQPGPHLQAGEYALRASMSPAQIVDILRQGKVQHYALTIPEGLTVREIAAIVAEQQVGDAATIRTLMSDPAFIASLNLETPSLEGYLFPDTYHLPSSISEKALLTLMVDTLRKNYTDEIAARADQLGLTQHEVLTLASLIEKEAQVDDERPLISAVYHNRLKKGMRLQCDPTVIYALGEKFDGNIRKRDLRIDSPYNTYRYAGLPPGPIANAGRRSLEAAVNPAQVDYIYFVATGDKGQHQFSHTLKEHNRAVQQYIRKMKSQRSN
ncbi:MAG: aminodeoxychorismate lyase [Candidatus Entotheonella factor]|uniref:Endolytic murein transglycosylase n=1 Tax=Entotheonella factor TaxID=1429438 RepID=W4L5U5_ENTF1|nr:endolytic transglycosylase MltG [Candidatus Entotheonella palauensis]ETW93463.1 MAG: aminodeoxychorismate lyase [Candidatus Entotheonella factor]